MSDPQPGPPPPPPRPSPFGKFQTIGVLAAVVVALVVALPYALNSSNTPGGTAVPTATVEGGDNGGGNGGPSDPEPTATATPEDPVETATPAPTATEVPSSLAFEDCVAEGMGAGACEHLRGEGSEPAQEAYLACRDAGLAAVECLGGTTAAPPEE